MASIRKLKSGNYQVQIRLAGLSNVTKSFSKKKDALRFIKVVEGDSELQRKLGRATSQIPVFRDWCDSYLNQYSGRDPSTIGRLNWWCDQFGEIPVTKIDEFMVDDGLVKLHAKGLTGSTSVWYRGFSGANARAVVIQLDPDG